MSFCLSHWRFLSLLQSTEKQYVETENILLYVYKTKDEHFYKSFNVGITDNASDLTFIYLNYD